MRVRRLFFVLVLVLAAIVASAQQITEQQAKVRALQYLSAKAPAKSRGLAGNISRLKSARVEANSIYAFNVDGGGYVIASGDSRALPVLGYSDKGCIDWDNMPDNMRWWLKSYDEAMASLSATKDFVDGNCQRDRQQTRTPKAAIEPMITTMWFQLGPYNHDCPLYDGANPQWRGTRCVTGCIATAMAQMMNYHQWPKSACKEIPAYDLETTYEKDEKTWHIDGLPPVTFDWANMTDTYDRQSSKAENKAVSTLMSYCGRSVRMNYTPEASASNSQKVVEALVRYFGYDDAVHIANRIQYSIDEWEDLIYSELAAKRPVQYGGFTDLSEGHSFICDGYDGDGFFHINWGWSGDNNGYYSLAVLNPYNNESVGASKSCLGFCLCQDAIIDFKPAPEGYEPQRVIPLAFLYDDDPVNIIAPDSAFFTYAFLSCSYDEILVDFAFGTREADGTLTPLYKGDPADTIVYNFEYNYHVAWVDSTRFEPGESQVLYPMVKFYNLPGSDWQLLGSKEFYVTAGRTPEGQFYLYRNTPQLEIIQAAFVSDSVVIGDQNLFTLTIRNLREEESTIPLYLLPYYYGKVKPDDITDETPYTQGDAFVSGAYLRPGEESDVTFCVKPMHGGTIRLKLCLADTTLLAETVIEVDAKETDAIDRVTVDKTVATYTDLWGRRLQGRPARKGIYIRGRRKEIVR